MQANPDAEMNVAFPAQKAAPDPAPNAAGSAKGSAKGSAALAFLSDSQLVQLQERSGTDRSWMLCTAGGFVGLFFAVTALLVYLLFKFSQATLTSIEDTTTSPGVQPSTRAFKASTAQTSGRRRNLEQALPKTFQNLNDSDWSTNRTQTGDGASVGLNFVTAVADFGGEDELTEWKEFTEPWEIKSSQNVSHHT